MERSFRDVVLRLIDRFNRHLKTARYPRCPQNDTGTAATEPALPSAHDVNLVIGMYSAVAAAASVPAVSFCGQCFFLGRARFHKLDVILRQRSQLPLGRELIH